MRRLGPSLVQREQFDNAILLVRYGLPGWRTAIQRLEEWSEAGDLPSAGTYAEQLLAIGEDALVDPEDRTALRQCDVAQVFLANPACDEDMLVRLVPWALARQQTMACYHPHATRRTLRALARANITENEVVQHALDTVADGWEDRVIRPWRIRQIADIDERVKTVRQRVEPLTGNAWVFQTMEALEACPEAVVHLLLASTAAQRAALRPRHWVRLCQATERQARVAATMAMADALPENGLAGIQALTSTDEVDMDAAVAAGRPIDLRSTPRTP